MKIFLDIVGVFGLLSLGVGAVCWLAPEDNSNNLAMAHFLALPFLALGVLLVAASLIGRAL